MLVAIKDLCGLALDWAWELAENPDVKDMRVRNGVIEIYILDDYHPPGWYIYQRRRSGIDRKDRDFVRTYLGVLFVEIPDSLYRTSIVVQTENHAAAQSI